MKPSRVQQLRDAGFDTSYAILFEHAWKVRCSQCEALVINGYPTHETGCPHTQRDPEEED